MQENICKRNISKVLKLWMFIFVFLCIIFRSSVYAEESQDDLYEGLTVWPSFNVLSLEAGDTKSISTYIKNENDIRLQVDVTYRNVNINENVEDGISVTEDTSSSPAIWLNPETNIPFIIEPQETVEFISELNLPDDAKNIGYYPSIIFYFSSIEEDIEVISRREIGQIIYLSVLDENAQKAEGKIEIQDFSVDKKLFTRPEVKFSVLIKNTGDIHLQPRGSIYLEDPTGKRQSKTLTINDKMVYLLPGQVMSDYLQWTDDTISRFFPPIGNYKGILNIYTEKDQNESKYEEIEFYVFPEQYIIYGLIGLVLIVLFLLFIYKRIKAKRIYR